MSAHILLIESPRRWGLMHAIGEHYVDQECEKLAHSVRVFMKQVLPHPPEQITTLSSIRWATLLLRMLLFPTLSVPRGAYWIRLEEDGNVDIGRRLSEPELLIWTGQLT